MMQCCAARHILIVLKLNRWQSFKLSNSYYATILENYFRGNALSRIEMQVTYSYKSFSTTVQSSKSSLSDFLSNNINKNDKKDTDILKGNNNKLDDFVEGLGKSRLNRHQRKKNRHERRTIQNSMPSSASITVESKENINTTKALPVPVTQDLYKEKQDKYEINRPPTIIENNVIETEYKEMKQNSHMALENTKITSKLHEQNYIQHYQNNSTENIILQPSKYSAQKYVSEYERSVHNNVCIVCTSVLQEFLDNNQYEFAFTSLKEYQRQDKTPAFPILLSLANWGGHNGRPDIVKTAEAMARKYFNSLFKKYLNFENHLAIAYMKAGKVTESFLVLENFLSTYAHHKYPKISKKKKDTLALIMNFLPMEKKSFIDEVKYVYSNCYGKYSLIHLLVNMLNYLKNRRTFAWPTPIFGVHDWPED
ncbi:unnamed protein product [Meganyctiphanes norvegica]|uniref:Uncharacterized protein n=1 Tax=Meganyctiphanes norvegica TaxID=48144 RepID=A0AAV2PW08_MEGNR